MTKKKEVSYPTETNEPIGQNQQQEARKIGSQQVRKGSERFEIGSHQELTEPTKFEELVKEAQDFLRHPLLIVQIGEILGESHIGDRRELILLWAQANACAGLPPSWRVGAKLGGNRSAGKDSAMSTVLQNTPERHYLKFTQTSDKFFQRNLETLPPILYLSEVNMRKKGANVNIVELLKALLEDGFTYGFLDKKKDQGMESVKLRSERRACFWSSTDVGGDDELLSRVLYYDFTGHPSKRKKILDLVAGEVESAESLVSTEQKKLMTILKASANALQPYDGIVIPQLKEIVKYIDLNSDAAVRYTKMLRAAIAWVTFIYQYQREVIEVRRPRIRKFLVAKDQDVAMALTLAEAAIRTGYTGVDQRQQEVIDHLTKSGEMREKDLKATLSLRKTSAWEILDELENASHLIERYQDPTDKRFKMVRLRPGGGSSNFFTEPKKDIIARTCPNLSPEWWEPIRTYLEPIKSIPKEENKVIGSQKEEYTQENLISHLRAHTMMGFGIESDIKLLEKALREGHYHEVSPGRFRKL